MHEVVERAPLAWWHCDECDEPCSAQSPCDCCYVADRERGL